MVTNIYMDFDGVINALSQSGPKQNTDWPDWKLAKVAGFQILWSPSLIEAIRELQDTPGVSIKWLTTWTTDAPKELAPVLGIGHDWEVLGTEEQVAHQGGFESSWWKLDELIKDEAATSPDKIVWLDDDIVYERWASVYTESKKNLLAISPKTMHGLTRKHIGRVKSFIRE